MKDKMVALLLSIFLGGLGIDRFYLGYTGMGILKLLTGGCFGVLWIIDIIYIITGKLMPADGSDYINDFMASTSNASGSTTSNNTYKKSDAFEGLEKASELYKSGVITDDEFQKIKRDLLERL